MQIVSPVMDLPCWRFPQDLHMKRGRDTDQSHTHAGAVEALGVNGIQPGTCLK